LRILERRAYRGADICAAALTATAGPGEGSGCEDSGEESEYSNSFHGLPRLSL
jgi:hypothetical protein